MAKKKLKRYKKLIITHDCLVPKGAMQVESVFKEEKEGITAFTKHKTYEDMVVKFDDEKQIMYNIMVKWNKADSDNWILDDEDIRRDTMIDYQQNGDKVLKFTHQKDEAGEPYSIDAHVMEFFFVKENDPIYPDYAGSIARSAYFKDKEEYDFIKELEFETSIEGSAFLEEFEVDDTVNKVAKENAIHKIKDLLKNTFNFKDGKLAKKEFNDLVENAIKDFDSVLENRKNTDIYYAVSALTTAIYNAEWDYLYGAEKDVDAFRKEVKTSLKQFEKYFKDMTFEIVEKEVIPNKNEGENMEKQVQTEVQAMIDKALEPVVKSLGLGEGQTIADVIQKAIGEIKPPESPVVKDKDGKEVTLVEVITGLVTKVDAQTEELIVLKKAATDNAENPLTDDEKAEALAKTKRLKDANKADSSLT